MSVDEAVHWSVRPVVHQAVHNAVFTAVRGDVNRDVYDAGTEGEPVRVETLDLLRLMG